MKPNVYQKNFEYSLGDITNKIVMQMVEMEDQFIFETIKPYCEKETQMKISKQELVQALLFWRNKDKMIATIKRMDFAEKDEILGIIYGYGGKEAAND